MFGSMGGTGGILGGMKSLGAPSPVGDQQVFEELFGAGLPKKPPMGPQVAFQSKPAMGQGPMSPSPAMPAAPPGPSALQKGTASGSAMANIWKNIQQAEAQKAGGTSNTAGQMTRANAAPPPPAPAPGQGAPIPIQSGGGAETVQMGRGSRARVMPEADNTVAKNQMPLWMQAFVPPEWQTNLVTMGIGKDKFNSIPLVTSGLPLGLGV